MKFVVKSGCHHTSYDQLAEALKDVRVADRDSYIEVIEGPSYDWGEVGRIALYEPEPDGE